jgi:capsular polysaccharide biosynthesis protein
MPKARAASTPTHRQEYPALGDDVVRLSVIGQILRRRWRFLLVLAVLGAVIGATASLLWPPAYESSSRVLVQGDVGKDRVRSEAQIAMSLVVLDRAATGLNWGTDGPGLRNSVTAAVADGNVIEIKAKAGSPDRARQLAEQVTQQYVAFSTEILTRSASASGEVLAPRKDSLQKNVADMNLRISELQGSVGLLTAANAEGAAARAELQQLSSNRTEAVKELNDLDGRIATAQAQAAASRENFSVIEPPVASPAPVTLTRLQWIADGAALAAVLGAFILVVVRQADRRLRGGSDIAAALGAPVLGTVEAPAEVAVTSPTSDSSNGHDADGGRSLPQRLLRNGVPRDAQRITASSDQSLEYVRYRRVLARLRRAPDESVRLLVVLVDDDMLAARAVGRLAIAAAVDGQPVSVVTSSPQLAGTVKAFLATSSPGPAPINVDVSTSADQSRSTQLAVLSVVLVSASRPTVPDSHDVSATLVVVPSGTRTAWDLLAIAEACHDAGHPVAGALMVLPANDEAKNADPEQLRLSAVAGPPRGRAGRSPA